jgi:hypothetical protein
MDRSWSRWRTSLLASVLACLVLPAGAALAAAKPPKSVQARTPRLLHPTQHDRSGTLRSAPPRARSGNHAPRALTPHQRPLPTGGARPTDRAVQVTPGSTNQPTPNLNFDGSSAADDTAVLGFAVAPSDSAGDVGSGHYVQVTNSVMQVWTTGGTHEFGPVATTSIFSGFDGQCGDSNFSAVDTLVRYDELAARWVLTFIPIDFNNGQAEYHVCIAVSTSSDPTGSYNRYEYNFGLFANSSRLGVWPDAYYFTFDGLDAGFNFVGAQTVAFDRATMLSGGDAGVVGFDLSEEFPSLAGMAPADLDGASAPPAGAPNHQAAPGQVNWDGSPSPVLHFFDFHVDFETPGNSTLSGPFDVSVPDFNPVLCGGDLQCIPELGGDNLNPTAGSLMHGMQYRNFGDHEAMVLSHTVNVAAGGDQAAVRWYEVRPIGAGAGGGSSPFSLFQSGTYSPSDTNRFVPSIAMDASGDIAMGYSISDATINPKIGFTGRLVGDPAGQMGDEDVLIAGGGSQTGTGPYWGNFTSMAVDPSDGCTFFYTNQYYAEDGSFAWATRIGSLRYPSCTTGASGTLQGTVTDGTNPLAGVKVTANAAQTTTDAAGHYSFTLPVGFYDMTASKYGFFPGSATGVEVTDGGTTTQDFTLGAAPSTVVNGVVKDSAGGWPLYAKIVITAPGAPTFSLYTDPVSGYYAQQLVQGVTYNFAITSVAPGYAVGGGSLDLGGFAPAGAAVVKNWTLSADLLACRAPGYSFVPGTLVDENFNAGVLPPGWSVESSGTPPWKVFGGADPCGLFPGNQTGGSGSYAIVNSNCDGFLAQADTNLVTPPVDMTGVASPALHFSSDFTIVNDGSPQLGTVDLSIDGGATWTNVLTMDTSYPGPSLWDFPIPDAANQATVKVRFHYEGFWAWWWQVDDVLLGVPGGEPGSCEVGSGGLIVGNVHDANNGSGLNGAVVENIGGGSTKTFATPDDPAQDDGLYILYADSGSQSVKASMANYASDQKSTLVVPGSTVRLDFTLLSGHLSAAPTPLNARVDVNGTDDQTLTLTNTGGAEANFSIIEINAPLLQNKTVGFADKQKIRQNLVRNPERSGRPVIDARSSAGLAPMPRANNPGRLLAAGDVIASYPSNITYGWGVAAVGTNVWLSNLGVAGGDDQDYEYGSDGALTGNTVDDSGAITAWAADGAFNPTTGKFWRVDVVGSGSSCIFEIDPVAKVVTGNRICPSGITSERGLAYDPVSNSFWVGSWVDGAIYHFDIDGNVLDSAAVNLPASGLAYNSSNGHLLVMQNFSGGNDIVVLDALNNYNEIGEFPILDNGSPAITAFGGAGAEFDCLGNLWVIDQNTQTLYKVASGESAGCAVDIPWFSLDPTEGTVAANGGTANSQAHWDAAGLLPGLRQAQIQFKSDTPFTIPGIPVSLVVRFNDVPDSNQFEAYIYGAAGAGVMFGGPPNCPAGVLNFCPNNVVTRADMAGYLFRGMHGAQTPPPVYQNIFHDVTFNDYNAFYIQGISDDGITAGCGNGNYCPNQPNTRAQMSVFIWKAQFGEQAPPSCTGIFTDVPCPGGFAADYIEALYNEGITAGCGGGNFCPNANITNGQMAVFIVKAFNIPHL